MSPRPAAMMIRYALLSLAISAAMLQGQNQQSKNIYLPDLGIIIDAERDSAGTVNMLLEKQAASAAYMESTRDLRIVLDQLNSKITGLENSLSDDMSAMRLENERLRSMIRKLQSNREEARAMQALQERDAEALPVHSSKPQLPARPQEAVSLSTAMVAYLGGQYAELIVVCGRIDDTTLSRDQVAQVSYWCADAHYRQGNFDEALLSLGAKAIDEHELKDDAIILRGLIYVKLGKPDLARTQFETILSHYPTSAYYRLAELTVRELHEL